MASDKNLIGKYSDEIKAKTGTTPEVTGGGKGWTASVPASGSVDGEGTFDGEFLTAKGGSKQEALGNLLVTVAQKAGFVTDDMSEAEAAKCVSECMSSIRDYCECKCGGRNHGIGEGGLVLAFGRTATLLGPKECLCGCGETTNRRFVPGHDARYHSAQKRAREAAALGLTAEEYLLKKRADKNAAIKAKRAASKPKAAPVDEPVAVSV